MIDLHMHLLPVVDDGAASLDVARDMLDRGRAFGFTSLLATPHLKGPLTPDYEVRVRNAFRCVAAEAQKRSISVDLGYEILLSPDLPARLRSGEPSRLGSSSAALVELPFAGWPNFTEQVLFEVQSFGFRPLLAHPERYLAVQSDPDKALRLVERGVLLQVTFGSLVGVFGKPAQRVAELLLRNNAATVLATDAHSAGQRFMCVEDGLARAASLVGTDRVRQLVLDNPKALLEDRPLPKPAEPMAIEPADRGWRRVLQRTPQRARINAQ
jgi:protein-tyrosine phosphatase